MKFYLVSILFFILQSSAGIAQVTNAKEVKVDSGWAGNSVNTVVFRKNSLVTYKDSQYIAFYNKEGKVVVGKRKLTDDKWKLVATDFTGNITDAHNSISIMTDGDGFLHMAWNHHGNKLHYVKTITAGSLEFTDEMAMTGMNEKSVTYPEFYKMPNGNLIFFYRDGGSGNGNLVMNMYDCKTRKWKQLQNNLIDGEGKRNAYWQACVDAQGIIYLSWVWREAGNVETNHDMCYAYSADGGITWKRSDGEKYQVPITMKSAEIILPIPQYSGLMNQTSMYAINKNSVYIATYWRDADSIPQYHVICRKGDKWNDIVVTKRSTTFSLQGSGTISVPFSRPQIIAWKNKSKNAVAVIFRDAERGSKVSVAINKNIATACWKIIDLTNNNTGSWEPTFDTELWKQKKLLHLFVEQVQQINNEGLSNNPPQMISVLQWDPKK